MSIVAVCSSVKFSSVQEGIDLRAQERPYALSPRVSEVSLVLHWKSFSVGLHDDAFFFFFKARSMSASSICGSILCDSCVHVFS